MLDQEVVRTAHANMRGRDAAGSLVLLLSVLAGVALAVSLYRSGVPGDAAAVIGAAPASACLVALLLWWNPRTERLYREELSR